MDPWPGAFTAAGGERIKVLAANVAGAAPPGAAPGEVVPGPPVTVACGDGRCLLLTSLQREGRRALSSADLVRGFPLPPGTRLGP